MARALVVFIVFATSVSAQAPTAECPTSPCELTTPAAISPALAQLWREAAAVHQIKLQFVDALQRFLRAQAGTFGDEGPALRESVAAMRDSLGRWDRSIAQLKMRASPLAAQAETHVALATVWLDRQRLDQALDELKAAEQIANERVDVQSLKALASGALGRTEDAARALRRVVALDPGNAAAYYTLAQYQTRLGRSEEAAQSLRGLERALQRQRTAKRDGPVTPFERVDLLRQAPGVAPIFPQARYAAGFALLRSGDYDGAITRFEQAMASDPLLTTTDARDRVAGAASLLKAGDIEGALSLLRRAASEQPSAPEIHRLFGVALWIADERGDSIEQLRTAITLSNDDDRARMVLADVLSDERRLTEAERELKGAPAPSGQVFYRLAQIYQRQSQLPSAAAALRDSESFGPVIGRDFFYQSWGSLLVNQADFDGAVAMYMRRIEVNPNSAEAHRQLGEIYVLQGRHDEALGELSVAVWLDPNDAKAHAAAGQVYARVVRYPEAIAALSRAVMLDENLREARYTLGTVLMRVGKTAEGKAELERFGRQQADAEARGQQEFTIDALRRQAAGDARAGNLDQAIARYTEAVTLDPQRALTHRDLGVVLLRARRVTEAIDHLQRAQQIEETADGYALLADAHAAAGNKDAAERMRLAYRQSQRRAIFDRIRDLAK